MSGAYQIGPWPRPMTLLLAVTSTDYGVMGCCGGVTRHLSVAPLQ